MDERAGSLLFQNSFPGKEHRVRALRAFPALPPRTAVFTDFRSRSIFRTCPSRLARFRCYTVPISHLTDLPKYMTAAILPLNDQ